MEDIGVLFDEGSPDLASIGGETILGQATKEPYELDQKRKTDQV